MGTTHPQCGDGRVKRGISAKKDEVAELSSQGGFSCNGPTQKLCPERVEREGFEPSGQSYLRAVSRSASTSSSSGCQH